MSPPIISPLRATVLRRLLLALVLGVSAAPALAAESGQTYFAHGAQTVYAGMMPPPGKTQFYGYTQFYNADSIRDSNGDRVPGFEAQSMALAPRVIHTWNQVYGGFMLSSGVLFLAVNVGVETPFGDDFTNGPTLYGFEPLYLTKSLGAWHFLIGTVIYCPIGPYDAGAFANSTLNRYGGAINGGITWTPTARWDVSLNYGYEFKGRNRDTEYRDGAQAGVTYGVGYRPFEDTRWDLGFSGYYTVQVEDDRQSGNTVPDKRLRKLAIGPKLGYWISPAAAVILQWHREYEVQNGPRGEAFWLMFSFPLGG